MNLTASDYRFLSTAAEWIDEQGEILALFRYSRAAGAKDFLFIRSNEELKARLEQLPPSTSVILFREPQLPLRGIKDGLAKKDIY
jgi:hypothetical protein